MISQLLPTAPVPLSRPSPVDECWDFDRTVRAMYDAATGQSEWRTAMQGIARSVDAWLVQMMGIDKRAGALSFSVEWGKLESSDGNSGVLDYIRKYHSIDPRTALLMRKSPGVWVHCHEHFDEEFVAQDRFYQEFLLPHGGRYVSGIKLFEDDESVVIGAMLRGLGTPPFNESERGLLARLTTHLSHALAIQRSLKTSMGAVSGADLLNRFRHPMLLLDSEKRIVHRNPLAADFLAQGDVAVDRGGRMGLRRSEDEARCTVAVRSLQLAASIQSDVRKAAERVALRFHRLSNEKPVVLFLSALRPQQTLGAFGREPLALAVWHDINAQTPLDPFILSEVFDLTPAEARVAVAISKGNSVSDIANQTCKSVETIRSQVQSILRKTGARRQSDLVRVLVELATVT